MFGNFAILDLSTPDLVIILAICLLLFGSKKLPELARSLGSSARELKKGVSDMTGASQELRQQTAEAVTGAADTGVSAQSQAADQRGAIDIDELIRNRRQF